MQQLLSTKISPDDNDVSERVDPPASFDVPAKLLECMGDAMAVIDEVADRVVWVSTAWLLKLPDIPEGQCWSKALANLPALAEICDELVQEETRSCRLTLNSDRSAMLATVSPVVSGCRMVRLQAENQVADGVRQYMEAREYLFSTSRTISVSEMATTLAHEINQPIGTISNVLSGVKTRLRQADPSIDAIEHALDQALDQARFTSSVIARIRDFTQARRPQQQQLDLRQVIIESVELLDWLFETNACSVELDLPKQSLVVNGDETMLQQVLINLLRNGVDAMQDSPPMQRQLHVSANCESALIHVRIRDQGKGLSGKEDTLFQPFVTSKLNGMGVGLNICRSFVELHQGRLWVSPNDEGGCTSNVSLPQHFAELASERPTSMVGDV